jgi:predicted outer membrane repeat protein
VGCRLGTQPDTRSSGLNTCRHGLIVMITLLFAAVASAGTIRVPEDVLSIQHAIDSAKAGDVIDVGPGRWLEQIDLRGKSILIRGRDGAAKTIIDATGRGDSVVRCITAEGPGTVLEGLTLTGGTGHVGTHGAEIALGGGLLALGASPTLRDCILTNNHVNRNGGGAYCGKGGDVRFERCTFKGNSAEKGAGLLSVSSRPVLLDCTFIDNKASYSGGGLFAAKGSGPVLRGCRFETNHAAYQGGGVCSLESAGEVLDCEFERNRAGARGGAMYLGFRTSMTASACAFATTTDSVVGNDQVARAAYRVGGCDLGASVCVQAEEVDCLAAGGRYRGDGSICPKSDTTQVARRGGDLNSDGAVDRTDLAILMLLWR